MYSSRILLLKMQFSMSSRNKNLHKLTDLLRNALENQCVKRSSKPDESEGTWSWYRRGTQAIHARWSLEATSALRRLLRKRSHLPRRLLRHFRSSCCLTWDRDGVAGAPKPPPPPTHPTTTRTRCCLTYPLNLSDFSLSQNGSIKGERAGNKREEVAFPVFPFFSFFFQFL
jgi:hypothetical protein